MKWTPAMLMTIGLFLGGCATEKAADSAAAEFLGANAVHVLSRPTRVEGWNFQRADGTIASDPPIRLLDNAIGTDLGELLLREETYRTPALGGTFERSVGYRVWRGDQSVDVLLSLTNDQMLIKYQGYTGQPGSTLAGVAAARDRLLAITKRAFPEYRPAGK